MSACESLKNRHSRNLDVEEADVAELVDATDSKSVVLWTCRFESDHRYFLLEQTMQ